MPIEAAAVELVEVAVEEVSISSLHWTKWLFLEIVQNQWLIMIRNSPTASLGWEPMDDALIGESCF